VIRCFELVIDLVHFLEVERKEVTRRHVPDPSGFWIVLATEIVTVRDHLSSFRLAALADVDRELEEVDRVLDRVVPPVLFRRSEDLFRDLGQVRFVGRLTIPGNEPAMQAEDLEASGIPESSILLQSERVPRRLPCFRVHACRDGPAGHGVPVDHALSFSLVTATT